MRRRSTFCLLIITATLLLPACSQHTSIMGEEKELSQVVHGSIGISGEDHHVTIRSGSDVTKLSIMGEDIEVIIEEGACVAKIEIIGSDNRIVAPADLEFEYSDIGDDNKVKRQ